MWGRAFRSGAGPRGAGSVPPPPSAACLRTFSLALTLALLGCGGAEPDAEPADGVLLDGEPPDAPLDTAPSDASAEAPRAGETTGPLLAAFVFDCDDGTRRLANFERVGEVILTLPGKTLRLPAVSADSGAKYSDGTNTFWTQEREARFETRGSEPTDCVENRRESILEDARRRGVYLWATGNEPGWTLEIMPEATLLLTDYGQSRYEFVTPQPEVDALSGTTVYSVESNGHRIAIGVRSEECLDSMSGERFETAVEIRLDDRRLSGCGVALY